MSNKVSDKIKIQIAYALPDSYFLHSYLWNLERQSKTRFCSRGILQQYSEIDLRINNVGIFSRLAKLTDVLEDGDRIEIYRPLLANPKRFAASEQSSKSKNS